MKRVRIFSILSVLLICALWVRPAPLHAQLVVVTEDYYITELRPDKGKIGVASGPSTNTRNWVRLDGKTRVARREWHGHLYRDVTISNGEMWRRLKPGMKIKVHGGRDFDQNIVAHKIWL